MKRQARIETFKHCLACGGNNIDEKNNCLTCGHKSDILPHKRFSPGDKVSTEFGEGIIVGIDLPLSEAWRWVVKITNQQKKHFLVEQGKPLAFFDKEVKVLTTGKT